MKLQPWDPDIETLILRIDSGIINLQPNFQRGEVWGTAKKKRLIDTILREWHIPPIHVVVNPKTGEHEVLDGQQRLAAIRDFAKGFFPVDGECSPRDKSIQALHNLSYEDLPQLYRNRFNTYPLRVIKITDYLPEEPGELFFRLNQPTNLTAAEQRNAFYGKAREQVKQLVNDLGQLGVTQEVIGFSNSRMAYDDVIAKVCYAHHVGSLRCKITANSITNMYKSGSPFSEDTLHRVTQALHLFGTANQGKPAVRYNKATLFSWLTFISKLISCTIPGLDIGAHLTGFLRDFGRLSISIADSSLCSFESLSFAERATEKNCTELLKLFNDKSTSRVADVSSVLTRDIILWILYTIYLPPESLDFRLDNNSHELLTGLRDRSVHDFIFSEAIIDAAIRSQFWAGRL